MKTHRVADVNLNDFEHKNQSTGTNEAMSAALRETERCSESDGTGWITDMDGIEWWCYRSRDQTPTWEWDEANAAEREVMECFSNSLWDRDQPLCSATAHPVPMRMERRGAQGSWMCPTCDRDAITRESPGAPEDANVRYRCRTTACPFTTLEFNGRCVAGALESSCEVRCNPARQSGGGTWCM